jgi:hypothetical protein
MTVVRHEMRLTRESRVARIQVWMVYTDVRMDRS